MASLIAWICSLLPKSKSIQRTNKQNIPLPKVCHLELSKDLVANKSVFVIGDIHGCYDELCGIMEKAKLETSREILYLFVGDLTNKGPKNHEVLHLLQQMGNTAFSVRGNHDESVIRELLRMRNDSGYEPPASYQWTKTLTEEDFFYLHELPYTISVPELNIFVVHAGLVPGIPFEQQTLNLLTNMRNLYYSKDPYDGPRLTGTNHIDEGEPWAKLWPGPEHVYFGHDARRKLQQEEFATGLDTGCVYGGELTGVFVNDCRKLLSVKAHRVHKEP